MVPNGGTIEEMASHEELMAEKSFYALYMSQLKGKGPGVMPVTQRSSSSAPNAPIWPPKLDWEQQVRPRQRVCDRVSKHNRTLRSPGLANCTLGFRRTVTLRAGVIGCSTWAEVAWLLRDGSRDYGRRYRAVQLAARGLRDGS
jgi:hypothetical protein